MLMLTHLTNAISSKKDTDRYHSKLNVVINGLNCNVIYLRNKSWKPECALSFNMGWRILVFYSLVSGSE